jgi:beta-glucuronidase
MIHRDKNHCSIIAWSVGNECETQSMEGREFFKELLALSRELDPFRYHTYVTNRAMLDQTLDLVDFVCANVYIGWYNKYDIPPTDVAAIFDNIWDRIQNDETVGGIKPLVISEFGAEAIDGYKDFANAHWSENYQYTLLKTYIEIMIEKGYIAGGIVWVFCDFRVSPFDSFLQRPREYNNKGILDCHRKPKISFYIVQQRFQRWLDKITHKPPHCD